MKANVSSKTETKTSDKAKAKVEVIVKVPAALKTAVAAQAAIKVEGAKINVKSEQNLVKIAETLSSLFDSREEAKPVLAQAYKDAGLTSLVDGSQRSRILAQAFPKDAATFAKAKAAPITFLNGKGKEVTRKPDTNQLTAIANGTLKPNKKGLWLKVQSAGNQGGHNAKTPLETLRAAIETAATNAIANGKLTWQAVLTQTVEVLKSVEAWEYDGDEAATLVSED